MVQKLHFIASYKLSQQESFRKKEDEFSEVGSAFSVLFTKKENSLIKSLKRKTKTIV